MAKNSTKSMKTKITKKEKKQEAALHSLIKDLRPKVYITDSSNFKKLVQELTGSDIIQESYCSSSVSSPQPADYSSTYAAASQTWEEVPMMLKVTEEEPDLITLQEISDTNFSFDGSPCFSSLPSSVEGSPGLYVPEPVLNYGFEDSFKNMDFESQFCDLDSLLMGTEPCDYGFDSCYGMNNENEVCAFNYDFDLAALM